MALAQSKEFTLNHIRAQYLQIAADEQSRKIIRPHPQSSQFEENEMDNWLARLESPPIPINVLEDEEFLRRLKVSKDQQDEILEESEEEDDDEPVVGNNVTHSLPLTPDLTDQKDSVIDSMKSSVATLKSITNANQPLSSHQRKPSTHLVPKYVPAFTKLFRQGSSSSTLEKKNRRSVSEKTHDEHDDDFDEDDDDEFDDAFDDDTPITLHSTRTDSLLNGNDDSKLELTDVLTSDAVAEQSGILVDQNYSDINESQPNGYNNPKYLFGGNSASSMDDDLLLDSDFSDDDGGPVIDSTFQTSSLQYPNSSRSSSRPFTPSRSSNRKLSFDKGTRPKVRLRRADSLNPMLPIKSSITADDKSLSHSNLEELNSIQAKSHFEKIDIKPTDPSLSKLSDMFNKTKNVSNKDPLEFFMLVSGENISNKFDVIDLTVYLPNEEQLKLKVRKTVTVFETIGYIILNLSKSNSPLLDNTMLKNPNRWCIKLIDEDGEPYEGSFGLLERTKAIESYGEDEVALLEVSETEFQLNETKTPNPQIEEPNQSTASTPSPVKQAPLPQNSYYKSIIPPPIDNVIKDTKSVKILVYDYPSEPTSNVHVTNDFYVTSNLNEVLVKYCKLKNKDLNDFTLKVMGEDYTLDLNDSISSLDGAYKLEALTKRKARELKLKKKKLFDNYTLLPTINSNLTPQTLILKSTNLLRNEASLSEEVQQQQQPSTSVQKANSSRHSSLTRHTLASTFRHKNNSKASLLNSAGGQIFNTYNTEYQKYTVWRRLPMSFMNRHERTFAIDGEYVYIMPNDEKMWFDTNFKTSTFHISQIISCKVSKRVPSNFKILVMKTRGPKRYDFEAINPQQSQEIIKKLHTLMHAYKINSLSVT